jgi:hypothetical protein
METISQRGERRRREPDADVRRQNRINHLRVLGRNGHVLKHGASNINENNLVAPTGFDQETCLVEIDFDGVGLAA